MSIVASSTRLRGAVWVRSLKINNGSFATTSTSTSIKAVRFNTTTSHDEQKSNNKNPVDDDDVLLYEGPFAGLTTRLKTVSISTAIMGALGIPLLVHFYSGDISTSGQYAVGSTAVVCACGSTLAMHFAFSPYIHKLERIPVRKCNMTETTESKEGEEGEGDKLETLKDSVDEKAAQKYLLKATTRNLFAMKRETVFDPATDIKPYSGIRPFCNFLAKDIPFYAHPHLIRDEKVRIQLVGETKEEVPEQKPRKDDDDELL